MEGDVQKRGLGCYEGDEPSDRIPLPPAFVEGEHEPVTVWDLREVTALYGGTIWPETLKPADRRHHARIRLPVIGTWATQNTTTSIGISVPGKGDASEDGLIAVDIKLPRTEEGMKWIEKVIGLSICAARDHYQQAVWDLQEAWREGTDAADRRKGKPLPWPAP
jgi:hypothetical protein